MKCARIIFRMKLVAMSLSTATRNVVYCLTHASLLLWHSFRVVSIVSISLPRYFQLRKFCPSRGCLFVKVSDLSFERRFRILFQLVPG